MLDRRQWMSILTTTGIGTAVFHRAATTLALQDNGMTKEMLVEAAWITDFDLSDDDADRILREVERTARSLSKLREISLDSSLGPAFQFHPLVQRKFDSRVNRRLPVAKLDKRIPDDQNQLAFSTLTELGHFLRTKQISSRKLTELYIKRLKKYGPMLRCVVHLTEALAIEQSDRADQELAAGKDRGPLHGIPWGAKDLIDVPGYPTTWGIPVYKERTAAGKATVYERLEAAGAVLVAKLSLGAIAMGDKWFGGMTRNPWNPKTGSSGSSAGSASATTAGLVGFSIGSETLGSITTPSKICGATGFRPTFGRVSRHGCMPLSWTMDKIGPICRSSLDCGLVFAAIHGEDQKDMTTKNVAFEWPSSLTVKGLRVGYTKGADIDQNPVLKRLAELGCLLQEVSLPNSFSIFPLANLIDIEAASVFDELLRQGKTEGWNSWPNSFKAAQFVSAIDYLRLMRLRTRLMHEMETFMSDLDFLVNARDVFHTNLTGHPSIVFPIGFKELESGGKRPIVASISGHLDDDARLLAFSDQLQSSIGDHTRPDLSPWLAQFEAGELDTKSD